MHLICKVGGKADGFSEVPSSLSNSMTSTDFFQPQNSLPPGQRVPGHHPHPGRLTYLPQPVVLTFQREVACGVGGGGRSASWNHPIAGFWQPRHSQGS